jgi:hypothetical protein
MGGQENEFLYTALGHKNVNYEASGVRKKSFLYES